MEPYYEAWTTSQHEGKATCVDCHYPPSTSFGEHLWHKFQATSQVVKYVTRTYSSKPFAVIKDESCLRSGCHSKRLLEGKTFTPKKVRFDHAPHLQTKRKDRQLSCTSCHSQIVIGKHIEVTYETCYLCHFKQRGKDRDLNTLGGCSGCHETPTQDFNVGNATFNHKEYVTNRNVDCQSCHIDVIQGDGYAPEERCVDCHNDPKRLKYYGNLSFIHETHVTQNHADCSQCHLSITHRATSTTHPTMDSASDQAKCNLCHTDKHTGQKMMYMGVGGRGVKTAPSSMYTAQVDCVGCHLVPDTAKIESMFNGQTYEPTKQSCVICHGKDYLDVYDMWKSDVKASLENTAAKIAETEAYLKNNPSKNSDETKKDLDDAKYNYDFVLKGHGIHNPDYADSLLRYANEKLDKILSGDEN